MKQCVANADMENGLERPLSVMVVVVQRNFPMTHGQIANRRTAQNTTHGSLHEMKNNVHRKLYRCDYFGWRYYCPNAARRTRKFDKHQAKILARKERKRAVREAIV